MNVIFILHRTKSKTDAMQFYTLALNGALNSFSENRTQSFNPVYYISKGDVIINVTFQGLFSDAESLIIFKNKCIIGPRFKSWEEQSRIFCSQSP